MARSSEVDALRRSGRARPLLLGGLALLAGALAVWEFARPKPRGLPERRDTILVVDDAGAPDAARALRRAGFDVVAGDLADWAEKADAIGIPDARILRRILMLADERGAGYVAFELGDDDVSRGLLEDLRALPRAEGGDDIDVDTTRELVVSVGDLADPHHVTVAPPPSAVVRMGAIGLVRAAFAQPMLAPDRPSLLRRPSLEELLLAEQLDPGVRMIKRIDTLETSARRMQEEVERTVASVPDAPALHDSLSSGGVVPIGDGAAITITRKVELVSFDGDFLDLQEAPEIMVRRVTWSEDEGHAILGEVTECTELGLAQAREGEVVELRASTDGRTWLVVTKSSGIHVWSLDPEVQREASPEPAEADPSAAEVSCGFVDLGVLPEPREGTLGRGVPGPLGQVARVRDLGDGRAVVEVVTPGASASLVQLMEFPSLRLAEPVWIDERHLAVFGRGAEDSLGRLQQQLMVLDTQHPLVGLKIDLTSFVGSAKISQVLPVVARRRGGVPVAAPPSNAEGGPTDGSHDLPTNALDVFLLSGKEPRQIHRVHVDMDFAETLRELADEHERMAAAAAEAEGAAAAVDEGRPPSPARGDDPTTERETAIGAPEEASDAILVSLVPMERTVHDLLAARGEVWDLTIDPQHTRLAFTWQPEPSRRTVVATLTLDGVSTIRPAGRERGAERRPRFDAAGRRLLFEATFPLSVMERMLIIPGLSPPVR